MITFDSQAKIFLDGMGAPVGTLRRGSLHDNASRAHVLRIHRERGWDHEPGPKGGPWKDLLEASWRLLDGLLADGTLLTIEGDLAAPEAHQSVSWGCPGWEVSRGTDVDPFWFPTRSQALDFARGMDPAEIWF